MKKIKILIIKLGYSETLDPEVGRTVSLGDVLRTTPLLGALKEKYKNSHISWLVSEKAEPLLHNNSYIDRLLVWDSFIPFQLQLEKFDLLINLEKVPGICALSDTIDAWNKHGFRFNSETGNYDGYEQGLEIVDYINQKSIGEISQNCWQKSLIELLGLKWSNKNYILGYEPKTKEVHDIGLNFEVGLKWPKKAMPMTKWEDLASSLQEMGYSISWQKGLNSIYEYIDWVNSCKTIITHDSLGLHLALALNKRVISLFGPSLHKEICFNEDSVIIEAPNQDMNNMEIDTILEKFRDE
ncbi:MAG: glycosyltransferase family 9 protein [Sulfurimonas sp.]|nr:glycosyltransferase family 9 protein [Sulfurimonas sp.]MDD3834175.1 glycosyltransferase family 9 protein [Sulfurimonas sp.]